MNPKFRRGPTGLPCMFDVLFLPVLMFVRLYLAIYVALPKVFAVALPAVLVHRLRSTK